MNKRYIVLENGQCFEGRPFGAEAEAVGELVFTTGMCGYIETLTDPSYAGQLIMQTFPLIGNYGIIEHDFEGECAALGYIVSECCQTPSNFRSEYSLDEYLKGKGIPGICGIDTRALTRILRTHGTMNAAISNYPKYDLNEIKGYRVTGQVEKVSCNEMITLPSDGECRYKVALLDYGAKRNIARELNIRGCQVTVMPSSCTAEEILSLGFDGVMLSNGPGDPAENEFQIAQIRKMVGSLPMFGICLGHQLLALAMGARTEKLPFGHRGVNQPVKDMMGTRTYITSQNHGYAVTRDSIKTGIMRYANANDGTCEGIDYPELRAFSVQFHPEACAGPEDTRFLFDRFIELMGGRGLCRL